MSFRLDDSAFYPGQPIEWTGLDGSLCSGQFMWWSGDSLVVRGPHSYADRADLFVITPRQIPVPVARVPRPGDVVSFDTRQGNARIFGVIRAAANDSVHWFVRLENGNEQLVDPIAQALTFAASAMP